MPRILVVDDDVAVLELLRRSLAKHYQVVACSTGEEAMELLEQEEYSLVITDLRLPKASGLEVLQAAARLARPPGVIIVTGYASLDSAIQATNDGAMAYVTKPFTVEHFLSRVEKVLAQWETSWYAHSLQERIQRLLVLNQTTSWMGGSLGLDQVLENVARAAVELADVERAVVLLIGDGRFSVFPPEEPLKAWQQDAEEGVGHRALADRQPQMLADVAPELRALGAVSGVVLPLIAEDRPEALLYALDSRHTVLRQDQVEILWVLASQSAVALQNAQLFAQLQQAYNQLQQLDHLKDEFISLVSHELRTPLHSISGFVELILDGIMDDPEVQRDCLLRVADQTRHLRRLVEELLDLSRIEAGRLIMDRAPLAVGPVVQGAVANLRGMADQKGITLEVAPLPALPMVEADGQRLGQVITNLVHNAIKFTPPQGQVLVSVEEQSNEVVISVADTGPGIPAEAMPKLFKRFSQVSDASSRGEGMGIGLYISKAITEAHEGRIWVESEVGKGSTFYVALSPLLNHMR